MKKKSLTKQKLLSAKFSGKLAAGLNDSLLVLRRKEGLSRVKVYVNNGNECFTDGFSIVIGNQFPLFHSPLLRGAELTYTGILGVLFHELGHVMYHHFTAAKLSEELIYKSAFWPCNPDNMSDKLKDYLSNGKLYQKRAYTYYCILQNCLCDARGEYLMLTRHSNYHRFVRGLELMRHVQFESACKISDFLSGDDAMSKETSAELRSNALFACIVHTGKFGVVKGLNELPPEHSDIKNLLLRIDEQISDCVSSSSAEELYRALNFIFCEVFDDYILPYLETLPDCAEDTEEPLSEEVKESLEKALGETMKSAAGERARAADCEAEKTYTKARDALKNEAASSEEKSGKHSPGGGDDEPSGSAKDDSLCDPSDDDKSTDSSSDRDSSRKSKSSSLWDMEEKEGSITYMPGEEKASIACTLERISKIELSDAHEDKIVESLAVPADLDFGEANSGVDFIVKRIPEHYPDSTTYDTYRHGIDIGKNTARKLRRFFEPVQKSQFEKDRYCGTRIVQSKLANPNLKIFAKRASNPAPPTLSVAILIDESGSMRGKRINSARTAAISLFEMCRALKVRYAVFGHTTDGASVAIHNYCHFDDNKENDKYKLLQIEACRENRDGAALRYVAEMLHRETTDRKLLIIVSDGFPSAPGYGGAAAIADIQQVIKDYEHFEGYNIVAAIIAEPKAAIRAIYGNDRSIDITSLDNLPDELIRVVKRVM